MEEVVVVDDDTKDVTDLVDDDKPEDIKIGSNQSGSRLGSKNI